MENTVPMRAWPRNLELPTELQGLIHFDPARQKLVCRGFMCKTQYDRLLRLSDDPEYQRAVATLFQNSALSDCPKMRQLGHILLALTIACLALVIVTWWLLLAPLPVSDFSSAARPAPSRGIGAESSRLEQDERE